ncbi:hypothetical protein MXB_5370 [Myxobolus squamalis]|nr:hypothetical protein MXB_5370 [Myxobolus squamalis]
MSSKEITRDLEYCPYTSCSEDEYEVDEHRVEDVTFKSIYTSHRIFAIFLSVAWIFLNLYFSLGIENLEQNMLRGFICACGIFVIISSLLYPNGPFIRPHPILWRIILGMCVIYQLLLTFCIFLSYDNVRDLMVYIDPSLRLHRPELKNYAEDCRFIWEIIKQQLDVFCVMHFFGWMAKALIIRNTGISWFLSIMWELSELFFQHLLPNFKECWWDVIILDILICNGLGITCGAYILKRVECRTYHWESIKLIQGTKGKLKRFILQFSPMQVESTNWLGTESVSLRIIQLTFFSILWQVNLQILTIQTSELNTFFLKHVFVVNTRHWMLYSRAALIVFLALAATSVITATELIVVCKHGMPVFKKTIFKLLFGWIITQMLLTTLVIYLSVMFKNKKFLQRNSLKNKIH